MFFLCFYITKGKPRDLLILIASFVFYAWGEPAFVFIAVASAMIDYYLCRLMEGALYKFRKHLLSLCIIQNLTILAYFKYAGFFVHTATKVLHGVGLNFDLAIKIALPIGVSFIVFEKITYAVDIYRGKGTSAPSIFYYLVYVLMFPKLLAGPIIKYHDIENQLLAHDSSLDDFVTGFQAVYYWLAQKNPTCGYAG